MIESFEIPDLLPRLVDRSLVHFDEITGRYHLLETVRQYSVEHAVNEGDTAVLRDQHLAYYLDLLGRSRGQLRGARQVQWLGLLDAEYDNIRLALEWALVDQKRWADALDMAARLNDYWIIRTMFAESDLWIVQLNETRTDWSAATSARLLLLAGLSKFFTGKTDTSTGEEALRFARQAGQDSLLGFALRNLTLDYVTVGRDADAQALADEALEVYARTEDWTSAAFLHIHMGNGALVNGMLDDAEERYRQCLALRMKSKDLRGVGAALVSLGSVAEQRGDFPAAISLIRQGISAFAQVASSWDLAGALVSCCLELTQAGRNVEAAKIVGFADALLAKAGGARDIVDREIYDRWSSRVRATLGDDEYEIAYRAGGQMTFDQALEIVFPAGLEVPSMDDGSA
ncbi:MAG: hypothetical protein QOJ65_936 [Fimbriimonadaceae bacterium]|nr:hypothetical protein [Fimbriimonadaceae bacterium]